MNIQVNDDSWLEKPTVSCLLSARVTAHHIMSGGYRSGRPCPDYFNDVSLAVAHAWLVLSVIVWGTWWKSARWVAMLLYPGAHTCQLKICCRAHLANQQTLLTSLWCVTPPRVFSTKLLPVWQEQTWWHLGVAGIQLDKSKRGLVLFFLLNFTCIYTFYQLATKHPRE